MKTTGLILIYMLLLYPGEVTENIPANAQKLIACYPRVVSGFADNRLILTDGTKLLWDDGIRNKSPQQLLENPDIEDIFSQSYPKGAMQISPQKNNDPGRIRNEAFFKKLYGDNRSSINKNLVQITWCPKLVGQKIRVTRLNGVAQQLMKVSKELDEHPELKKYLTNIGGTFNWRYINGTKRLSTHSFGTTIDINTTYSDYWEWACKCTNEDVKVIYRNRIPQAIIDAFERHGFIWGGKWYHYDTMHFEYRPELL